MRRMPLHQCVSGFWMELVRLGNFERVRSTNSTGTANRCHMSPGSLLPRAKRCKVTRPTRTAENDMCLNVFRADRNKVGVLPGKTHTHVTSVWSQTHCLEQPTHITSFAGQPSRRCEEPRISVLNVRTHVLCAFSGKVPQGLP